MKHLVFTWGKFEIPHVGHMRIINAMFAYDYDRIVFCSPSKTQFISNSCKSEILKECFHCPVIVKQKFSDVVKYIAEQEYADATMVIGQDRFDDFSRMLHTFSAEYKHKTKFHVHCLDRTIFDMSSTEMRNFIDTGNEVDFYTNLPENITLKSARKLITSLET
jgi:nicotinic acid mononucleotide adenylyltransferase